MIVVMVSSEKYPKCRENLDDHMIRLRLVVERYENDDIDREHKNPLPSAELADLYLVVELIDEYGYRREYREKSDQFHDVKVGYRLDFCSDFCTTDLVYMCQEGERSECEHSDREEVWVEIERHKN